MPRGSFDYSLLFYREQGISPITTLTTNLVFAATADGETEKGGLLLFGQKTSGWRRLGETLPLGRSFRPAPGAIASEIGGTWPITQAGMAIFYRTRGNEREAYLFDANSDQSILLASFPVLQRIACGAIQRVRGLEGFWIACGNLGFIYKPGYEIKKVTLDRYSLFDSFLYATNEGAYISSFGGEVWQGSAGGQKRRLWPAP